MNQHIPFELKDAADTGQTFKGYIEISIDKAICIHFDGYGEKTAAIGENNGTPILIEVWEGTPVVRVFGDINSEDITQSVYLDGAAESKLKEEE